MFCAVASAPSVRSSSATASNPPRAALCLRQERRGPSHRLRFIGYTSNSASNQPHSQRRVALPVGQVDARGRRLQQRPTNVQIPACRGVVQRHRPVLVGHGGGGAAGEQQRDNVAVAVEGGEVQGGVAVLPLQSRAEQSRAAGGAEAAGWVGPVLPAVPAASAGRGQACLAAQARTGVSMETERESSRVASSSASPASAA